MADFLAQLNGAPTQLFNTSASAPSTSQSTEINIDANYYQPLCHALKYNTTSTNSNEIHCMIYFNNLDGHLYAKFDGNSTYTKIDGVSACSILNQMDKICK